MPNILTIHRILYVFLGCSSLALLAIAIWTLADPVVHVFYYDMKIKSDRLPNKADTWNFFVISIVSLFGSAQLVTISVLALWANAKRICLFRVVTWYNLLLISFSVAGIALVATNRDVIHDSKLRSAISTIMEYKEKNYYESENNRYFMDTVQNTVGCCGTINADVYVTMEKVPSSCDKMFGVGCLGKSLSYLDTRLRIFAGLHGIILILQIATLFVSCFAPIQTKKKSTASWSPVSQRSRSSHTLRY